MEVMKEPQLTISLPDWAEKILAENSESKFADEETKMKLAIELSELNMKHKTGGPFGAAIFCDNKLIAVGVNLVTSVDCSVAHAEITAIISAQNRLKTYDLSQKGSFELATSTEPCCMCMGAVIWSGLRGLICGATDSDAREAGFDEGPKPDDWQQQYRNRSITVKTAVLRDEAKNVLETYKTQGGAIYNPKR